MGNLKDYYDEFSGQAADRDADQMSSGKFWKAKVGENTIRFLPPRKGKDSIFTLMSKHWIAVPGEKRKSTFVCPKAMTRGKSPCPACDMADRLESSRSRADQEQARDFQPRKSCLAWIIDRGNEAKGPQMYDVPPSVVEKLRTIRNNRALGGDFSHPLHGFDIVIKREGTGAQDTRYDAFAARTSSKLHDDEEQMIDWFEQAEDLAPLALPASMEEISEILGIGGAPARAPAARIPAGQDRPAKPARTAQDDIEDADLG